MRNGCPTIHYLIRIPIMGRHGTLPFERLSAAPRGFRVCLDVVSSPGDSSVAVYGWAFVDACSISYGGNNQFYIIIGFLDSFDRQKYTDAFVS